MITGSWLECRECFRAMKRCDHRQMREKQSPSCLYEVIGVEPGPQRAIQPKAHGAVIMRAVVVQQFSGGGGAIFDPSNWTAPLWHPTVTRSVSEGVAYSNFLAYASGYNSSGITPKWRCPSKKLVEFLIVDGHRKPPKAPKPRAKREVLNRTQLDRLNDVCESQHDESRTIRR